jgi:cobalt/nickel transport protein
MDRRTWLFLLIGLGLTIALAAFVSPFASSSPDGLERVAQDRGFAERMEGQPKWLHAPMPDYAAPGVKHSGLSTALAGVAGVLLVFAVALAIGWALRSRRQRQGDTPPAQKPESAP